MFADAVEVLVEAVSHDRVHADHVNPGLVAAGREIPLEIRGQSVSGRAERKECSEGQNCRGPRQWHTLY